MAQANAEPARQREHRAIVANVGEAFSSRRDAASLKLRHAAALQVGSGRVVVLRAILVIWCFGGLCPCSVVFLRYCFDQPEVAAKPAGAGENRRRQGKAVKNRRGRAAVRDVVSRFNEGHWSPKSDWEGRSGRDPKPEDLPRANRHDAKALRRELSVLSSRERQPGKWLFCGIRLRERSAEEVAVNWTLNAPVLSPGPRGTRSTTGVLFFGHAIGRKGSSMSRLSAAAAIVMAASFTPIIWAGPYSPADGASTAVDAGVPGFVGPSGDGVVAADNYLNPVFKGWVSSVVSYTPSPGVDSIWQSTAAAVGPVTGNYADVVSLGDLTAQQITDGVSPGQIVLSFSNAITNGAGADFAVFENVLGGGTSAFCELAYVEVSGDGISYARFPSVSLTPGAVNAFGWMDPTNVHNLAGKHSNGNGKSWGTPFDLADLAADALVQGGEIDLTNIRYVRLVDIPGTGYFKDSLGNPIYDPSVTVGSGGLDLEAVGVINAVPEPGLAVSGVAGLMVLGRRRRS